MPKFIKKFIEARKQGAKLNALAQTQFTIEQTYKLYFFGIDGYITGKPGKLHRLVFQQLIWRAIDKQYNNAYRKLVKDIAKKPEPDAADLIFIRDELRPYFENSLRVDTTKTYEMLGGITQDEAKHSFDIYQRQGKAIKGVYK